MSRTNMGYSQAIFSLLKSVCFGAQSERRIALILLLHNILYRLENEKNKECVHRGQY